MSKTILLRALLPVTASVLVHAGAVTAIVLGAGLLPDRTPVLVAELADAEAPPAPPPPPRPVIRPPSPIVPPKPIATPLPSEPPPARPVPEPVKPVVLDPPPAVVPEPPRALPEPPAAANPEPETPESVVSAPPPPGPTAPRGFLAGSVASVPDPGPGQFAPRAGDAAQRVTPPASPSRGTDVAALPPNGVTRQAIPQGGYQYRPAYPARARALGVEGTARLHVHISDRGRVTDVVVKQSAGHPDLDQAATAAVLRWRFEPARRGDDAVAMWVEIPFEFKLR